MKNFLPRNQQAWMLAAALLASASALHAATTDIANAPPAATISGVKPNVMFLLDDSGSMTFDHLPDNVGFGGLPNGLSGITTDMCRAGTNSGGKTDCLGTGSTVTVVPLGESGLPYFTNNFNLIYYNPTLTYIPPVDYDGTNTTYKSYTDATAPFKWSTVRVDPFPNGTAGSVNVQTSFPEQVFCDNSSSGLPAAFDAVHCRRNVMTNATFSIGLARPTTTTARVTLANHGCQIGDTVTISGATQAAYNGPHAITAIVPGTSYDYAIPNGTAAPTLAAGKVFVSTACNIPITKLSSTVAGSFTVITAVYPIPHGCNNGELVTFKALPGTSSSYNGTGSVTVVDERRLAYSIAFAPPLPPVESTGGTAAFVAESSLCAGTRSNYSTSTTVPPLMQGFPQGIFTNHKLLNSNPHYFTIGANEYCKDDDLTKCEAPVSETIGATAYTFPAAVRYCTTAPEVSLNPAASITSITSPSGSEKGCFRLFGRDSTSKFLLARYGYFTRVDIVGAGSTYPKAGTRTDCAGATTCTYNEEMTNVANWYAYYRTRIQMVKTAAGIAFKNLSQGYRVGFNSINATSGNGRFLPIKPFDTAVGGQKSQWFAKFYGVVANGGTPLRGALSRIGRYYGGMKSGAAAYISDDPIEASCQQNFTFLTTDGYWTTPTPGSVGIKLDGTNMGDQDCLACTTPNPPGTPRPILDAFSSAADDGKGTLADVAYYYYKTDLRTGAFNPIGALGSDVTLNNVSPTPDDPAQWQHMVTFTMGLGLSSNLIYKDGYTTPGTSADYDALVAGTQNWPAPVGNTVSTVDDLWHAAVNGHGTYFSAKSPAHVVSGIASAFATVARRNGAVAAPATSNPNLVPGDNFLFTSTFTTIEWTSEIKRRQIDLTTGAISSTPDWTAQAQLDAKTTANSDSRTIKTFDSTNAATHLRNFAWANLTLTEQGYFNGGSGGRNLLGQWFILSGSQQSQCDVVGSTCGEKLVNYLRGQRGFETTVVGNTTLAPDPGISSVFRHRVHILGDTVNAEAVYVRQPVFNYFDQGYSAFKSAQASRPGTLYAAANDGMLHALDANTGAERWAYIPTIVMPNMWHLADFDYANNHIYMVDGTPVTGDICTSNCSTASAAWATILVGGLNAGGRGFYALDITDPANPKALWELKHLDSSNNPTCIASVNNVPQTPAPNTFSDCDIGLSFGNPIITKRSDGKWVVLVTSGYNNVSPGTGGGFLYIVDAVTGAILNKTATLILNPPGFAPGKINAGDTTTPSGFAKINAFAAHTDNDNTTLRVYGGDLNGNLWRIDGAGAPNTLASGINVNVATLLAILGTANALNTQGIGTANSGTSTTVGSQSITTKPELGEVLVSGVGTFEMVYVGTGRYLGNSDPAFVGRQSFYGIKDPLGSFAGYGVVHGSPNMVQQTVTQVVNGTVTERHVTANTVNLQIKNGWFIDLDPGDVAPGERSNTDPSLDLGILSFTTNAPNTNSCDVGGKSYIYFLDYTTGGPLPANLASGLGGLFLDNSLASRVVVIRVGDQVIGITVVGSQPDTPKETPLGPAASPVGGKRIYWRELNF